MSFSSFLFIILIINSGVNETGGCSDDDGDGTCTCSCTARGCADSSDDDGVISGVADDDVITICSLARDPRASYEQSLEVLRHVKTVKPDMVTKTSLMLGMGETDEEVLQTLKG